MYSEKSGIGSLFSSKRSTITQFFLFSTVFWPVSTYIVVHIVSKHTSTVISFFVFLQEEPQLCFPIGDQTNVLCVCLWILMRCRSPKNSTTTRRLFLVVRNTRAASSSTIRSEAKLIESNSVTWNSARQRRASRRRTVREEEVAAWLWIDWSKAEKRVAKHTSVRTRRIGKLRRLKNNTSSRGWQTTTSKMCWV